MPAAGGGELGGGEDEAVDSGLDGLLGPPRHEVREGAGKARLGNIRLVVGGQDRHAENAQLRPGGGVGGGSHGLGVGMHRQEGRAEPRDGLDPFLDGVGDVVELHVEEDALAGGSQIARESEAAGKGELVADLVERDVVAEALD